MVRRKNVLATLMHSFILAALISVQWALWGYSLAFSPWHGVIGGLQWIGLSGVSATEAYPGYSATIPHQAYMVFQCMFAVITPALITGAFAERISFKGFLAFSILWATLIYDPLAHWVWGVDGWLHQLGALDFAGGTVVHISSGFSALAAVLMIGRRQERWQRVGSQRSRGLSLRRYQSRGRGRYAFLGSRGMGVVRQADGAWRSQWSSRGFGRHNTRFRLCWANARDNNRPRRRRLLLRGANEAQVRL
jgi:ammonia channel protein AmtB